MNAAPAAALGHELVAELLGRGLVAPEDVVGGDLALRDLSRRNRNVLVERRRAPSHFVKWAGGREQSMALRREADRCVTLTEAGLGELVPRVRAHDDAQGLLVLEGFPEARDLRTFHLQEEQFPAEVGALLGAAIARVHQVGWGGDTERSTAEPPWVLSVHRPRLRALRELTPSSLDLVRIIQGEPVFPRELDRLRDAWQPRSIVHNDLKWDNVLLTPPDGTSRLAVRIVDWEHSSVGEPLWDVGSLIAGYLSFWLFSMDVGELVRPAELPQAARYPLEAMTSAIRRLWETYLATRGIHDEGGDLALRAVRAAGARLLATAHEATQGAAGVNAHLVLHVQLAANLLERPADALGRLGLDVADRSGA